MSERNQSSKGGPVVSAPLSRQELLSRFGEALVQRGLLSEAQLEGARSRAVSQGERLERVLLSESLVTEEDMLGVLARITGLPFVKIAEVKVSPDAMERVPVRTALHYRIVPLNVERGVITLASSTVHEAADKDKLRILLGFSLEWVLCTEHEITQLINHYYGVGAGTIEEILPSQSQTEDAESVVSMDVADSGIMKFLNQVIQDAIRMNATDIHFEPFEKRLRLRYRLDGVLYTIPVPGALCGFHRAIVSCIKVMAGLDIAEKRLPHDGRIKTVVDGEEFDLRVSILPTQFGESADLRILNRKATFMGFKELGLRGDQLELTRTVMSLSHGLVLITGPTGSGKTTTLYAMLSGINKDAMNIITIEDPVEYQIDGINQIQVNSQIGLTFAAGLRSVLRHDPDVLLVGEIRDTETAAIAIQAALTGHLVFSTLHTNDSAGAAARLTDMGIEPYLVASSVEAILAQRLVRRICAACREETHIDEQILAEIARAFPQRSDGARFYRGAGCPNCRFTGYDGRKAIFEMMAVDDDLRARIVRRAASKDIMRAAVERGLTTLRRNGWAAVLDGDTTVEDVLRVTHREPAARDGAAGRGA